MPVPKARQIPIAHIIGHDENDIWPVLRREPSHQQESKQDEAESHMPLLGFEAKELSDDGLAD
jgi:hypothetical protein